MPPTPGLPPATCPRSALAASPQARVVFDALDSADRFAFCWRVQTARRAVKFVAMMERG
jgi:uncharacterized protein YdeI (YjbR/CyaY-like superfamily)